MPDNNHDRNRIISKMIIETLGHEFFNGKTVVDLGSHLGGITSAIGRLVGHGTITAVDARDSHLKVVSKAHPNIKTIRMDLDKDWSFRSVDLIISIDLICHLKNWSNHLRNACNSASRLILETAVLDSDGIDDLATFPESKNVADLSFNGFASIPSAANIEHVLSECGMKWKRHDTAKLNNGKRVYDWRVSGSKSTNDGNYRRFWVCEKDVNATTSRPVHQMVGNPSYLQPGMVLNAPPPQPIPVSSPFPSVPPPTYPELPRIDLVGQPKVAVCISGNLRTFEKTTASFKHFILGNLNDNASYFIHTWDTLGARSLPYDAPLSHVNVQSKMNDIQAFFNPRKIVSESQLDIKVASTIRNQANSARLRREDYGMFRNNTLVDYFSMLYSWKRSMELLAEYEREKGIKYDIVIKHRSDLLFKNPIDIRKGLSGMFVPYVGNCYRGAMNDMFAVGRHDEMMVYLSLFDSVVGYLNNRETVFRPEWLIRHHLVKNGIAYGEEQINYGILRPNGNFQPIVRT